MPEAFCGGNAVVLLQRGLKMALSNAHQVSMYLMTTAATRTRTGDVVSTVTPKERDELTKAGTLDEVVA